MQRMTILIIVILLIVGNLFAETLEETIEDLSGKAAEGYVGPIVSAFGTNLNGGWYHKAPKSKFLHIDIEFGIVFMGTTFPDDVKDFDVNGNFRFTEVQADSLTKNFSDSPELQEALMEAIMQQDFEVGIHGPTIIGSADEEIVIDFPEQEITVEYEVAGQTIETTETIDSLLIHTGVSGILEDMPMLPLGAPQLSVGTLYGTKLIARYLPPMDLGEELGEFSYTGLGIQHNPKAWIFLPIPVDVSASFFTQHMELGNYISARANAFGINVSKQFGFRMLIQKKVVESMDRIII